MGARHLLLGALLFLPACGPGILTTDPPSLTVVSPTEGAVVTSLSQVYSGTCTDGLTIAIAYDVALSGPATTPCANGSFSFSVSFPAIASSRAITLTQTDTQGHSGSTTRTVVFQRDALALAQGFDGSVSALSLTSAGLYVAGSFTHVNGTALNHLSRLTTSGAVDTTFSIGTGPNNPVNAILLAPDSTGDIYIGGSFTSYNGTQEDYIARVTSAGTLNATFVTNNGFDAPVLALAPTSDGTGSVYAGGSFTTYNLATAHGVARLTTSGALDTGFNVTSLDNSGGTGGPSITALSPAGDGTGDIYVGGVFTHVDGVAAGGLVRLDATGAVSAHVPSAGSTVAFAPGTFDGPVSVILVTQDGSNDLYVGGSFTHYTDSGSTAHSAPGLARLTNTGGWSSTFNGNASFNGAVSTLIFADVSGDLYVGGSFSQVSGQSSPGLARLFASGGSDATFVVGGGVEGTVNALALTSLGTGPLYVGGKLSGYAGGGANNLFRCDTSGNRDTFFLPGTGFDGAVSAILPTADGSGDVYVGGSFTHFNGTAAPGILRLQMNGAVSPLFSPGTGFDGPVLALLTTSDGSGDFYAGGSFTHYRGNSAGYLVRISSSGAMNGSFNLGISLTGAVNALCAAPDGSGEIYVGGAFTEGIARLQSNGSADLIFAPGTGFTGGPVFALAATTDGTGDVYVGGDFTSYDSSPAFRIARVQRTGAAPAFTSGTGFTSGGSAAVRALLLAPDGSGDLFVGGDFTIYAGTAVGHLARLSATGPLNSSFNAGGSGFVGGTGVTVTSLASVNDGTGGIFVGGNFQSYDGLAVSDLAKLTAAGSFDPAFSSGSGFDNPVNVLLPAPDGSTDLYVGGLFHDFNGLMTDPFTRLSRYGSPE